MLLEISDLGLNRGLTFNKPTPYLLDYVDFHDRLVQMCVKINLNSKIQALLATGMSLSWGGKYKEDNELVRSA